MFFFLFVNSNVLKKGSLESCKFPSSKSQVDINDFIVKFIVNFTGGGSRGQVTTWQFTGPSGAS